VRAQAMRELPEGEKAVRLADVFCRQARLRVDDLFSRLFENADNSTYRLAQEVLRGEHAWLAKGIIDPVPEGVALAPETTIEVPKRNRDRLDEPESVQLGAGA